MSGYDKSPDYGGPEPSWRGDLKFILFFATIIGLVVLGSCVLHAGHLAP